MKVDHHKFLFCISITVYCITFKQRTVHICLQRIIFIACLIILYWLIICRLTSIERYLNYVQYKKIRKGYGQHCNPINPCAYTCARFNLRLTGYAPLVVNRRTKMQWSNIWRYKGIIINCESKNRQHNGQMFENHKVVIRSVNRRIDNTMAKCLKIPNE